MGTNQEGQLISILNAHEGGMEDVGHIWFECRLFMFGYLLIFLDKYHDPFRV